MSPGAQAADQVVTFERPRALASCAPVPVAPIQQSYILIEASPATSAKAVLLFFIGGNGELAVADQQLGINSTNFLVRSRHLFAALGFHVALMDAATDYLTCPSGLRGQRSSAQYTSDMQAVIDDLRTRYSGLPVWAVGTSRGATAAAQAGVAVAPSLSGIVLVAAVTETSTPSVFDVALSSITEPVLIVVHKDDACWVSPPGDAAALASALTASQRVRSRQFQGGFPALDSNACNALTPHGFIGLEPTVVEKITKWIEKQS